jgi:hypothetical protein
MGEYTRSGVIGRPSLATAEKGKAVLASLVDSFASVLEILQRGYKPRPRPMISFMISVVPPKMDCTRLSAQARATGYSRM